MTAAAEAVRRHLAAEHGCSVVVQPPNRQSVDRVTTPSTRADDDALKAAA